MEFTAQNEKNKKLEIVLATVFSLLFLVLAAALAGYSYFKFYSPVKLVSFSRPDSSTVVVNITSATPVKTKVEYGTSDLYLNATDADEAFQTTQSHTIWGLLPGKTHFFRVIAKDSDGKTYFTKFYQY
ncbi:MAG TPA: hypothetical protein VLI92_01645 [Candidatus Saccharimonadales bacterium]|nr:hypothetical protein [Candidatus Saccharimonadales bacterium]